MSDLLHTHLEHGFCDGCPACAQVQLDLRRSDDREVAAELVLA